MLFFAVERAAVKRVVSLSENTGIQTRLHSVTAELIQGEKAVKRRRYMLLGPRLQAEMDVRHGL